MQAREAYAAARQQLGEAGLAEAEREALLICAYLCGVEPGQLALQFTQAVSEDMLGRLLQRRLAGEPLQYVLGEAGFMGLNFAVGPGALVPRADTEILAEKAIALLKAREAPLIADIGTGSGALAVSLAYYLPQATIHGVDISAAALEWAKKNALAHEVVERCHFYEGDLLHPLAALELRFDMLVSNPPYVTAAEMMALAPEISWEPAVALLGGADGLDFYRRLAQEATLLLKPDGWLLLEYGWQQQAQVAAILEQAGWRAAERLVDYGGRHRGILARRA